MKTNPKILFISGSPRKGNTDFALLSVYNSIAGEQKEIIYLKDHKIDFCKGCLACHNKPQCVIKDDMKIILDKMMSMDILVLGSPNYFDNVSGIMKNFMDRCHPLYEKELIKNKKIFLVFTGGGENSGTKKYLNVAFEGFVKYLKLKSLGCHSFKALNINDLKKRDITRDVNKIVKKLIK